MSNNVRENRLRRAAERQGFRLVKSRRRDPRALDYGRFMIVDRDNRAVAGELNTGRGLTIDQVESFLNGDGP